MRRLLVKPARCNIYKNVETFEKLYGKSLKQKISKLDVTLFNI